MPKIWPSSLGGGEGEEGGGDNRPIVHRMLILLFFPLIFENFWGQERFFGRGSFRGGAPSL